MNQERWRQVDLLLQSTLEQPPERRLLFLAQSCTGDEELLAEVKSLLDHHKQATNTIEGLPGEVAAEMLDSDSYRRFPGQRVGIYQIVRFLGAGGMGEVYLAKDESLGRQVSLKLLPERFTQYLNRVHRFEKEARAASGLNHPNIVTIHQIGEVDGTHFMVTEFIEGHTLRRRLMDGPMALMEALDIAIQVASALEAAHAAGIVHRDIKPENIMLRPDGLVKVLDFGLAKLAEREESRTNVRDPIAAELATHSGVVMGTAQYMSPEQACGHKMDSRTDTFSLGVVLYEMVTGHAPFTGATITAVLAAVVKEEPLPLAHRVPAVPLELERIVRKAIAKTPENRYASTREMHRDLQQLDQELKLQAKLAEFPPALMNRRRAVWLGSTAVVTASLFGLGAWKLWPTDGGAQKLAVLPFFHNANDGAAERISDFITGALIDSLKPVSSLKVTERTAVADFKQWNGDLREVGRQLDVKFILNGTVIVEDENLSIDAKLQDPTTGRVILEKSFGPSSLGDAYRLQAEIASEVVYTDTFRILSKFETIQSKFLPNVDPKAWDFYRRGRHQMRLENEFGYEKALSLWKEAIALDDKFTLAYCGIGSAYGALTLEGREAPDEANRFLEDLARRAARLDRILPEVYCLSGNKAFFRDWDWEKARVQYEKMIEPTPGYVADPIFFPSYVASCRALGDTSGALKLLEKGISTDPNPYFVLLKANLLAYDRQFDRAVDIFKSLIGDYPSDPRAYSGLEETFRVQGNFQNAIDARRAALEAAGPYSVPDSFRNLVLTAEGEQGYRKIARASAELELRILENRDARFDYVSPLDFARVYAQLGEKDSAIKYLNQAFDEKSPALVFINVDPVWDNMRGDSRFRTVVRKMKFPVG